MSKPVLCGPLLRYTYVDYNAGQWNGSLLVVLGNVSTLGPLRLLYGSQTHIVQSKNIFSERKHTFWRYSLQVELSVGEQEIKYSIDDDVRVAGSFWIPGNDQSMRVMFHSCNGFSVKIPADLYTGPALWNDVLRVHADHPFHVMIGGGDQIYSDRICVDGPLKSWATDLEPRHRARTPFTEELSKALDEWYFTNYVQWFTTHPFREASAAIPTLQLWDDHDIIDGYGSYHDRFMRTPVFLGIGKAAYKYYLLFQQHTPPGVFLRDSAEATPEAPDPSFVLGSRLGPYIPSVSVSLCTHLGPRTVFFGLECRVERTRTRICYDSTYDNMFAALEKEVVKGRTRHLIILLGVPIAYPRLVWLEGLLSSSVITKPIKWSNKLFGVGGGMFNKFDGTSELLDDLNDHWCAMTHKHERNKLVERLQEFAAAKGVRVTILSGDVHLAAVGRFYSAPRHNIPQNKDPRYMVNVISSAITNAPPPTKVANLLHRRNHDHHLNWDTHENLMPLFRQDAEGKARATHSTMPARNYAIITEHAGLSQTSAQNGADLNGELDRDVHGDMRMAKDERGGTAEQNVSADAPRSGTTRPFALDVAFRVEINPRDNEGRTKGYGFSIPALEV